MSSLFGGPKPPAEDPETARLRKAEQERAERDRIRATQEQLTQETLFRGQGLGIASLTRLSRRRGLTSLLGSG